jgi:uncharacterized protein (DUF2235 family)
VPRKIVICFDGTWNDPGSNTNVRKMFEACDPKARDCIPFYYDGVGSEGSKLRRAVDGAFGEGVVERMQRAYADLIREYRPGDEVYIFGFSRGAYTARCFANMITEFGVPTRFPEAFRVDAVKLTEEIFSAYRDVAHREERKAALKDYCLAGATVNMLGVWDTVAAMGWGAVDGGVDHHYSFLNPELTRGIRHACHALAADERRREFSPLLFDNRRQPARDLTLEQVWFAGVHSDVGGGYKDREGLSNVSLGWMMERADNFGLPLDPAAKARYVDRPWDEAVRDAEQAPHESWRPAWGLPAERRPPPGAVLSSTVAYTPLTIALHANATSYQLSDTLPPPPGSPNYFLRHWDPIEALSTVAYENHGTVTPATLTEAFNALQGSLAALEKQHASGSWMANRMLSKLNQAFLRQADRLDYTALNRRAPALTSAALTAAAQAPAAK